VPVLEESCDKACVASVPTN